MDYNNLFSAFSKGSVPEINCGIIVLKIQRKNNIGIVYFNQASKKIFGLLQEKTTTNVILEDVIKDEKISKLISELIPEKSIELESEMYNSDIHIYKDTNKFIYIHIYPKEFGNELKESNTSKPQKFLFLFNTDFTLAGMSPSNRDQLLFNNNELIGEKAEQIFSPELGLAMMDGMIQSRKNKKEEFAELFSNDSKQKVQFIFAFSETDHESYYLAFLDYIPNNLSNGAEYFTINDSFKHLLDELPNVVIIHNNGVIVYANIEASEMAGIPIKEMIGRNILQQIPPAFHSNVIEKMKARTNGDQVNDYQIEVYGKNGNIKKAIVRSRYVIYNNNPCSLIILNDITDMKVLENKLIQGKEETETIINSISSGVIIIDAETHIIQKVNKAAATLIGTDEKDLIGRECNDFICPNSKGNCTIECTSEKVDNAERTIRSSLGECIPILKTVTLFQYNGRDCYLESFVDITKIKSNELLIQRKEHILSAIAELTDELLKNPDYYDALSKKLHLLGVATGVDRIYLFENDVIDNELMLSCSQKIEWASNSAEPQIDNPDLMNVPYEAIDIFIEPLKNNIPFVAIIDELEESYTKDVLQSQDIKSILVLPIIVEKTFWGFVGFDECKFERVWTEDEYSILLAFAGTLSAAIDRRKLEYSLQESMRVAQNANRAKSEFLANMSHEIRTPLNAVIGFTDLLMATQLSDTQSDYLRSVNNSAVILLDLINDILDYSKIEAGKLELFLEKTDIRELVNQISDIVKYKAHAKQLEFLISIDENTPQMVMVDGIRLRQVLINLLWNAIKFTDKGEVELSINYKPLKGNIGSFHFCIRDTGIGIPLNKQKVIFEAFSQVDTSATRKYGGTGLGLPISMNLIRKMDSQLVLKSAPGEGSVFCFTIELPIYENTSTTIKNSKTIKHIDIVDDNETNLKILKKMIENMGLNVRAFQSPTKALESIVSETDVYIVDYTMPELNGLSFIEAVKESKKLSGEERYILLHSSTDEIAIKEKATKLNISNVVSKPITSIQLQRLFFPTESRLTTTTNNPKLLEPEQDISQNHFRILIVEDNQVNMKLAISLIRVIAPNSKIFEAQNGRIALEMFEKSRPHLVFMDIQMPEMNGYDAASHIREMEINAGVVNRVPIIALTAGIVSESKDKCFTAGMDDFLPKPIQISCIEAVFRKWVGNLICKKEENSSINPNDRFDKEKLLKSAMNNESLLKELFSISKETLPQYYEALKQGFDNTNWESIKENAHAIKGQALTMQCSQLASLAREAELKAMNKDNSNIAEIITKIGEEIDYLINISFI